MKARVVSTYSAAADHYDHPANHFWDRFGRGTVARLAIPSGSRVLDLCCGTGASALPAAEAAGPAGRVVGVDLSEELLELARRKASQRGLRNVDFVCADIMAPGIDLGLFDHVICVFGVFFIPDMVAAVRTMWRCVDRGGGLAVTTWGAGVFEPANSLFWDAVRRKRPQLYKSFNPWDRVSEPQTLRQLFRDAELPEPDIMEEKSLHPLHTDDNVRALLFGTGYRAALDQLTTAEQSQILVSVVEGLRSQGAADVRADVIYAIRRK